MLTSGTYQMLHHNQLASKISCWIDFGEERFNPIERKVSWAFRIGLIGEVTGGSHWSSSINRMDLSGVTHWSSSINRGDFEGITYWSSSITRGDLGGGTYWSSSITRVDFEGTLIDRAPSQELTLREHLLIELHHQSWLWVNTYWSSSIARVDFEWALIDRAPSSQNVVRWQEHWFSVLLCQQNFPISHVVVTTFYTQCWIYCPPRRRRTRWRVDSFWML